MEQIIRNPGRWSLLALAVLLLGAVWTWAARIPDPQAAIARPASPTVGFPAPDFTLQTLAGQSVALSEQRGQVVVVNLWASWCGPCRAEMPAIQQVYDAQRERGLQVLAVNSTVQDSADHARAFADELGLTFPILLDRDGDTTRSYAVRALPSTFIIDRAGIIREVIFGGPISAATLESKIQPLLAEQR